jgi:transposase
MRSAIEMTEVARMGRPNTALVISDPDREQLRALVRSHSMPHSLVRRAQIVLLSSEGESNREVARRCGVSAPAVSHWRRRYQERGLAGLHDELRPGRPRTHDDETVAELISLVLQHKPAHATQWSVRSAAQVSGISKSTVGRYFALFGLQPHRSKSFKLSTDPFFVEKVRDIVGLYLDPPDNALVLCVDEKSQVQALERSQPVLPMGLGYVEGVTHDYYRHGTTTLFAALDVLDGKVITQCKPRHRHQEFLAFLNHLDRNVPPGLDIHLIADNYGTHKHAKVKAWMARHPRYHIHYTPTYASWLNQVERWFGLITQQAIRRGSFHSVKELVQKIDDYVAHYNLHRRPFAWTATADSILAKLRRLCKLINGTLH